MGALALLVTVAFLGTMVYPGTAQTTMDVDRYVALGSQDVVRFPAQVTVILDCLPYAINTYGVQANLSTIRWFRIATKTSETVGTETEITMNGSRLILSGNKERLTIEAVIIATGAERGTEAAYRCEVCRNVPPEPQDCSSTQTEVNVFSPPVLECPVPSPITVTPDVFITEEISIGCDLCFEVGLTINILDIICNPSAVEMIRTPVDCVMTTPNGTDVTLVNDPTFSFLVTSFGGSVTASISEAGNPETFPGGMEVLGTWTCVCNNSDGRAIATSTLAPCLIPPVIDKGITKPPIVEFPPYVSSGSRSFKIGSNDSLLVGQTFFISCSLAERGNPPARVRWFKDGVEQTMFENLTTIRIETGPSNDSSMVEGAGEYECRADNPAGMDDATSNMRAGIELLRPPEILKGPSQPVPINVDYTDQTERIGTDVHIIEGRMATIMCQLMDTGLPAAMVQWTRDGLPLNETVYPLMNNRETLSISNVSPMDEAVYCCSAENAAGMDSACSGLFVRGGGPFLRKGFEVPEPVNPARVYPGTQTVDIGGNAYAVQGSNFEVMCPVTFAEPPVNSFMWTYIDGGVETPIATHVNGSEISTVRIGNTEFLVTTDIDGQISRLLATGNDTGFMVRCSCVSPLGTDMATSSFNTFVAPEIDEGQPSDIPAEVINEVQREKIGSTVHIVEGQSAMIDCAVFAGTGLPEDSVNYTWYYNGMQIMSGGRFSITVTGDNRISTLTVDMFTRADNGHITCVAFNPAGQSQSTSEVFVYSDVLIDKGNASTVIGPEEPLTGKVGDKFLVPVGKRAFINCDLADAGGFPYDSSVDPPLPARVQWFKDGEPVDLTLFSTIHGNQLCVDVRNINDTGDYMCKITSRIVDNPLADDRFQMDSATSNVMLVSGPMINRGELPENATTGSKGVAVGTAQTRVISSGTNVVIRCALMSTTMPASTITWSRFPAGTSGEEIIMDDGSKFIIETAGRESELTIAAFDADDVGTYRCTAENTVGFDSADVRLSLCPADAIPCPSPGLPGFFDIQLEVTEGLSDTCPYCVVWRTTDFGPCNPPCHAGLKRRYVRCETTDELRVIDNQICANVEAMPPMVEDCTADFAGEDPDVRACQLDPKWKVWPWSPCSRTCTGGKQTRVAKCLVPRTGIVRPDLECPSKPATERPCKQGVPCGCTDLFWSCRYVDGQMCRRQEQIRFMCCASCTQGRSNLYH